MSTTGPIEAYMAIFARHLAVAPRRRRRILEETEGHLLDAAEGLVAKGRTETDAQRQAIERYGGPEGAAASFGTRPVGVLCRGVFRVLRRLPGRWRPTLTPAAESEHHLDPGCSSMCDICGREVAPADSLVTDLSAVGEVASHVTMVVHRACYDLGGAILQLRGTPVTAAGPPPRDRTP